MFVTLVPKLAPMIIGIAPPRGRVLDETRPTIIEVVTDEL